MLKIAVAGAAGRMGRRLVEAVMEAGPDIRLAAATVKPGADSLGMDVGLLAKGRAAGVAAAASLAQCEHPFDVLIDFTSPAALAAHGEFCAEHGRALVVGTTGLSAEDLALLAACAERIAVLHSPNMSVGVNLSLRLLGQAAAALGDDFDVEIVEAHHRHKKDAPSGTALAMGRSVAAALGRDLDDRAVHDRTGIGPGRRRGEIGFAVVRGGDIVGEHTTIFAGLGERLEITHKASSRMTFARGALRAARWIANRPPGLYSMADVLAGNT